jgi:glycosyltransferase involved in cell wall biosynthesis
MDRKDSSLGFFYNWVMLLSTKFENIEVICLKGKLDEYENLPANVKIHSLGKEYIKKGGYLQKIKYIFRFYKLLWVLRNKYNKVFVHMNQEYLLLGGMFWKLFCKPVFMWRNHYDGSFLTDIAASFCRKVFCTSRFSYTAKYKKTVFMPVGVDESSCRLSEKIDRLPNSILFLGRLDVSKCPHILIEALGILAKKGFDFTATFVGGPSKTDVKYPEQLVAQAKILNLSDRVKFVGAVPNTETFKYYRSHDIFVNCSRSGMFDKTIFKSIACGCLTLATSGDFESLVGNEFIFADNDSESLAKKLAKVLLVSEKDHIRLKGILSKIIKKNNLQTLVNRIMKEVE